MKHLLTYIAIFVSGLIHGQAGTLDLTFSLDGISYGPFASANGIAFDSDKNIFAVGGSNFNDTNKVSIIKFKPSGIIDSTFGINGIIGISVGLIGSEGQSIAIQADHKIIIAGSFSTSNSPYYTKQFAIRLLSNGGFDNTFGNGGVVIIDFPGEEELATCLLIQPDGRYIIAGTDSAKVTLTRLEPTGDFDLSFGLMGKKTIDVGAQDATSITSAQIDSQGKIMLGCYYYSGVDYSSSLMRLNNDGSLDNSFNNTGIVTYNYGLNQDHLRDICLQSDGKIIAVGDYHDSTGNSYDFDVVLRRYNTNGSIDSTFGTMGTSTVFYPEVQFLSKTKLQVDGKIIVGGLQSVASINDFLLLRFNNDGSIDSTFGLDGRVVNDFFGGNEFYGDLVIDPDLKILASGITDSTWNFRSVLVRYISGLTLGVVEFSKTETPPLLYPNPLQNTEVLKYTLADDDQISIVLLDGQGKLVATFVENENQTKGDHEIELNLPTGLQNGTYFIQIVSPKGKISIKTIK